MKEARSLAHPSRQQSKSHKGGKDMAEVEVESRGQRVSAAQGEAREWGKSLQRIKIWAFTL
jgi:hypothetical protein